MHKSYDYSIHTLSRLTNTHLQLIAEPRKEPMHYTAGQYLMVKYPHGEFMPLSIANAPSASQEIELHLRAAPEDLPTQQFLKTITQNKIITLKGPLGDCQYIDHPGPLLLLAAGTGFAPTKAIIEQLISENKSKLCYLYWSVKQSADFYLPDLPALWKKTLPNFHYTPICTHGQQERRSNIFDAISMDFGDLSDAAVYVFGPQSLALDAIHKFFPLGLKPEHYFTDVLSKKQILKSRQIT